MASNTIPNPLDRETQNKWVNTGDLREILLLELNCVIVKASKSPDLLATSYRSGKLVV